MQGVEAIKRNKLAGILSRGFAKKRARGFSWHETVTHYLPEPWLAARKAMRLKRRAVPLRLDDTGHLIRGA